MSHAPDPSLLDPGVRRLVMWLRSKGYETTDSGDGVSKPADDCALDIPHVHMTVAAGPGLIGNATWLVRDLTSIGITVEPGMIQATYDPADGTAILSLYGVTDAMLPPETRPS